MGTAVCVAGATKRTFSGLVERRGLTVLARATGCLPMVVADGRRFGHPSHKDIVTVKRFIFSWFVRWSVVSGRPTLSPFSSLTTTRHIAQSTHIAMFFRGVFHRALS